MNFIVKNLTRRFLAVAVLGAAVLGAAVAGLIAPREAMAHEVPCPICGLKVVQNTKTQDNEVVLRFGKKKIEYRCVYCAVADSDSYKGDIFIYAPSEEKGKPVLISRTEGKWAVVKESEGKLVPAEGAVFINSFSSHKQCAGLSRAFHNKEAFDKYVAANKAEKAKALTLDELVAAVLKK